MEQLTINAAEEELAAQPKSIPLHEKIQILIDNYSSLKEKYAQLSEEKNKLEMDFLELDDSFKDISNQLSEQAKINLQLTEQLNRQTQEIIQLKTNNENLENITKVAASKIDVVLSQLIDA